MFKNKQLLKVFIALLICTASSESFAISLDQALIQTYNKNPAIQSAREKLKSIDENAPQALSGWFPTIRANLDRGYQDIDTGTVESNNDTTGKSIELSQPLFRGGATISSMKQAKNTIMAARAELQNTEQQILLSAITSYLNVIKDQEIYELNKKNVSILEKHLNATNERFKLGEVTKTDTAQAEANLAKAKADKILAEGLLESSRAEFKRIIGELPANLKMPSSPEIPSKNTAELTRIANESNPLIKLAEYNHKSSANVISARKSALLPTLDLRASSSEDNGNVFSSGTDFKTNVVELNLSVPLYQSGAEYSRIRQAKRDEDKLEYDLEEQRNAVKESVIKAFHNYQVAKASITSNEKSVDAFKLALEGTEQEAKLGSRTTLDVLDAEQDLLQAKVQLVESKKNEVVEGYNLLFQLGLLTLKNIKVNTEEYDPEEYYNKNKYKIIGF